jgi:hypothetical protein
VVNLSDYEPEALAEPEVAEPVMELVDETSAAPEVPEEAPEAVAPIPDQAGAHVDVAESEATEPEALAANEPDPDEAGESDAVVERSDQEETGEEEVGVAVNASGLPALGNVAVIEGALGVTVTASTRLGKTKSRTAPASAGGVDRAVVSAVSRLMAPEQDPPLLVEVIDSDRDGEMILTVVLELEAGQHAVGSAIQAANRPWALARATRAALNALE